MAVGVGGLERCLPGSVLKRTLVVRGGWRRAWGMGLLGKVEWGMYSSVQSLRVGSVADRDSFLLAFKLLMYMTIDALPLWIRHIVIS